MKRFFGVSLLFIGLLVANVQAETTGSIKVTSLGSSKYQLEAVPASGYRFIGWQDGDKTNPRTITDNSSSYKCTAAFALDTIFDGGTVSVEFSNPTTKTFTLTAANSLNTDFKEWSTGDTARSISITEKSCMIIPIFTEKITPAGPPYIDVYDGAGGKVIVSMLGRDQYEVLASPALGYKFIGWQDGSTTNPRPVKYALGDNDVNCIAAFVYDSVYPYGSMTASFSDSLTQKVQLSVSDGSCSHFLAWTNGATNSTLLVSEADCFIQPTFDVTPISPNIEEGAGGTIEVEEASCEFIMTARANPGYIFAQWEDGTTSPTRIVDWNFGTYTASFIPETHIASTYGWDGTHIILKADTILEDFDSVTVAIGTAKEASTTLKRVDWGIYSVSFVGLLAHVGELLQIRFYNSCGDVLTVYYDTIPQMIFGDQKISSYKQYKDFCILDGGKLTVNADYEVKNVTVYGGGKLSIPAGRKLIVDTIMLKSGGVSKNEFVYVYPQLAVNGTLVNRAKDTIYYDYLLNNNVWYPLSVPTNVKLADIRYLSGNKAMYNRQYLIEYYDGDIRSRASYEAVTGWQDFRGTELKQGTGYNIFLMPEKTVNVGKKTGNRVFSSLRIPIHMDLSTGENQSPCYPVYAYGLDDPKTSYSDMGWNFLGNPYLTNYRGMIPSSGEVYCLFVTIPADDGQSYTQMETEDTELPALRNFFVQIGNSGEVSFEKQSRQMAPQYLRVAESDDVVKTGVIMSGIDGTDKVGVRVAEEYTDAYEINADLAKFENAGLNFYALSANQKLAFVATNAVSASESIQLGYTAKEGAHFIDLNPKYSIEYIEHLYLIDHEENNLVWDLLRGGYMFVTKEETNNTRFTLQYVAKTITPMPSAVDHVNQNNGYIAVGSDHQLQIFGQEEARVQIFSVSGQMIANERFTSGKAYALPSGMYIVRMVGNEVVTLSAIVK